MSLPNADTFFELARERYLIKQMRECSPGIPESWTLDPIFRQWRFCNVFREDDKTTKWFRQNVRGVLRRRAADVLFATVLFRWFNRIETGEKILPVLLGGPERWDPDELRSLLKGVKPIVTGAYMIKTPPGICKLDGIIKCVSEFVPSVHEMAFHCDKETTLEGMWTALRMHDYLGSFMAYEITTDLRHTCLLSEAPDIMTWAAAGPGCARGLGWVAGNDPDTFSYTSQKDQKRMLLLMQELLKMSEDPAQWPKEWPRWEMREVEHWLCETFKYIRCRDFGRPPKEKFRQVR